MTTYLARRGGLYFGGKFGEESFSVTDPQKAIVFGDQHRSPIDIGTDDWKAVDCLVDDDDVVVDVVQNENHARNDN